MADIETGYGNDSYYGPGGGYYWETSGQPSGSSQNNAWQTMINPADTFIPQTLAGLPLTSLPIEGYQNRYFGEGYGYGAGRFIDQTTPLAMQFGAPQQTIQTPTQRPLYTPSAWEAPAIGTVVQKQGDQTLANIQTQLTNLANQQASLQNQLAGN